ncbi:hypothetical protein [Streptomyces sp. NPDC055013]
MSLAAWALLIASISAVGTVANMIASWATFKRRRPRVKVRARWVSRAEDHAGEYLNVDLTIVNHGESSVIMQPLGLFAVTNGKVNRAKGLWVLLWYWCSIHMPRKIGIWRKWNWDRMEDFTDVVPMKISGDVELEVAPFNGVRWSGKVRLSGFEDTDFDDFQPITFRIAVMLSTGQSVFSDPSLLSLNPFMTGIARPEAPDQLSLFHLPQIEGETREREESGS